MVSVLSLQVFNKTYKSAVYLILFKCRVDIYVIQEAQPEINLWRKQIEWDALTFTTHNRPSEITNAGEFL